MPVSLAALEVALLQQRQVFLPFTPTVLGGVLPSQSGPVNVLAALEDDGDYLKLWTHQLCTCRIEHPRLPVLMQQIAALNGQHALARVGWDPSDGEVCVEVALPLQGRGDVPGPHLATALAALASIASHTLGSIPHVVDGLSHNPLPSPHPHPIARPAPAVAPSSGPNLLGIGVILLGVAALLAIFRGAF